MENGEQQMANERQWGRVEVERWNSSSDGINGWIVG